VVGRHAELTDALADVVAAEPGLCLVGVARTGAAAVALAADKPDVFVVDLDGLDVEPAWLATEVTARLIGWSTYHDTFTVRRTLDAGFERHLSKSSDLTELLTILLEEHVVLA
jgi:DNA-binding NarL/FixJ family response regulator